MNRLRLIWPLFLAACLLAPPAAIAQPTEPATAARPAPDRELLVMLRLPPAHYRGGAGYTDAYADRAGRNARRRLAMSIAQARGLTLVTDWPMPLLGVDCYVMRVGLGQSPVDVAAAISKDRRVAWSEPMGVFYARADRGGADPMLAAQPAATQWRLSDLHEISTGRGVRVAVIDSLVDRAHPDLQGQVLVARDFTRVPASAPEVHGTGVAGVIGARAGNGLGIAGIAPDARLMALRACWEASAQGATVCDTLSLARALEFALLNGAQIINLSLSGPDNGLLDRLLDLAQQRGVWVVAAYDKGGRGGGFPASRPGVIVAADESVGVSAGGVYVAPGRGIPTTSPGGKWQVVDGSSYAAAHVSGLLALVLERHVRERPQLALVSDRGRIDACATLLRAWPDCACRCERKAVTALVSH